MFIELEKEGNNVQNSNNQKEEFIVVIPVIGSDKSSFGIFSFEFSSFFYVCVMRNIRKNKKMSFVQISM